MKKKDEDYQKEVRCTDAYRVAFPIGNGNVEIKPKHCNNCKWKI